MWADLKSFILQQFRLTDGGSLYEQWLATAQTTTVHEYRRKFIELAAPLERIPENIWMGQFINGLRDEIRAEVRLLSPMNLEQGMEMALRVAEQNRVIGLKKSYLGPIKTSSYSTTNKGPTTSIQPASHSPTYSPPSAKTWTTGSRESQASVTGPRSNNSSRNYGEFKRLSDKELQEKRNK